MGREKRRCSIFCLHRSPGRVFDQLGYEARVVATGGLAHRIAPASKHIAEINLELTLQGLRMIYDEIAQ